MKNEEKVGRWLRSNASGRGVDPEITARLAAFYGPGELQNYTLATEDEIHTEIEMSQRDPAVSRTVACPCGKYPAWARKANGLSTGRNPQDVTCGVEIERV